MICPPNINFVSPMEFTLRFWTFFYKAEVVVKMPVECPTINHAENLYWEDVSEEVEKLDDSLRESLEITVYEMLADFGVKELAEKVRGVVRMFGKAPVKNDALQKKVFEVHNKKLSILKDYKTR